VSKSALYHYFPSKQELFAACTELVTQPNNLYGRPVEEARSSAKDEAITSMLTVLDTQFQGEMFLLLDYIRGKSAGDVANDPLMQMANTRYLNELANTIGDSNADQACALILGGLMMRLLNGQQTDLEDIASWVMTLDQ
jgi:AcrR family transcriptional regulator